MLIVLRYIDGYGKLQMEVFADVESPLSAAGAALKSEAKEVTLSRAHNMMPRGER